MVFGDNVFSKIILKSYVFGKIHTLTLIDIKVLIRFEAHQLIVKGNTIQIHGST
jgi:hypothetical protein